MIIAAIKCFFDIIFAIWFVVAWSGIPFEFQIEITLAFINILFQIVGILHANKARKQIDGTEGYSQIA